MAYHYSVVDADGNAIVIEPIDGKLIIHQNTLGVVTNSPEYEWHMTNMRNYINLNPIDPAPLKLGSDTLESLSQGYGLYGLPGDTSSPSRFVRVAFFKSFLPSFKNSDEGVFNAFHVLNNFDIPMGSSEELKGRKKAYDFTQWMSANDLKKGRYYFRTYDDYSIKVIDLKKLDLDAKGIKVFSMKGRQKAIDVTKDAADFK